MSASAPTSRFPNCGRWISCAGAHVPCGPRPTTLEPSAIIADITFAIFFMPPFMLLVCRSVEIESGRKPAR